MFDGLQPRHWKYEIDGDRVLTLLLDRAGASVNSLSREVLEEPGSLIDRIQNEDKVEVGELFFTTGEDRIFPKGLPVGRVVSVQSGPIFKNVELVPTGLANGRPAS